MTLTEFLLARIAEDEAWAREPDGWNEYDPGDPCDPARVLAECEAKRRIVAPRPDLWDDDDTDIRYLALIYADHPDYQEKWKQN